VYREWTDLTSGRAISDMTNSIFYLFLAKEITIHIYEFFFTAYCPVVATYVGPPLHNISQKGSNIFLYSVRQIEVFLVHLSIYLAVFHLLFASENFHVSLFIIR